MRDSDGREFSIRPASSDDLPQISALEQISHLAPWTADHFAAEMQKPYSKVWVLTDDESDSTLAGYLVFQTLFETVELINIVTAQEFRGLGFAKAMIQRLLGHAVRENAKRVILDVRKSNLAAVQLYQGQGFNICLVRRHFYTDGEDAYHLENGLEGHIIKLTE